MNVTELETELAVLFQERAKTVAGAEIPPFVPAEVQLEPAQTELEVLTTAPGRGGPWLAAAAILAALAFGGWWWASSSGDTSPAGKSPPPAPVFLLPDVEVNVASAQLSWHSDPGPTHLSVIGVPGPDGGWEQLVSVRVSPSASEFPSGELDWVDHPAGPLHLSSHSSGFFQERGDWQVFAQVAALHTADPEADFADTARSVADAITLSSGGVPDIGIDGFETIGTVTIDPGDMWNTTLVFEGYDIQTLPYPAGLPLTDAMSAQPANVNGQPALWITPPPRLGAHETLTWEPAPGVVAIVSHSNRNATREDLLAVAQQLTLVDETVWLEATGATINDHRISQEPPP
ncbi:MAG: hypothetical protein GY929_22730 [Actinomycetia bacterium]|nr:hypothetical protein [Actinomycetes bacterium]